MPWPIKLILKTVFTMPNISSFAYVTAIEVQPCSFKEHMSPRCVCIWKVATV